MDARPISPRRIMEICKREFGENLYPSNRRGLRRSFAIGATAWSLRILGRASWPEVAALMGKRSHSSIRDATVEFIELPKTVRGIWNDWVLNEVEKLDTPASAGL